MRKKSKSLIISFIVIFGLVSNIALDIDLSKKIADIFNLRVSSNERIAPDGETFTLVQLSGAYTDVDDDPDSHDDLWLNASGNNVHTSVLASFSTPSASPSVGADLQELRVRVHQYDELQSGTPTARIELWENGGLIRAGSDIQVPDVFGGIILSFTWNANELSISDGSQVECYVFGTKSGGSPTARNTVEVDAIEWNAEVGAVEDNDAPTWDTLTESDDPLELGNNETININVYDDSTISWVYLEFAGDNHTMEFISGDNYRYALWQPSTVGVKDYRIYMSDEFNNINQTGLLDITVQDTTAPLWFDLIESADPLELGSNETITVNATDISGINLVYLEYESSNHTMVNIYGNTYQWSLWLPASTGLYNYTIYVQDNSGLWNNTIVDLYNITVQDTILPLWFDLIESDDPLTIGNNETITVNATDASGINLVYLEYESANHTMQNLYGNTYNWSLWLPASTGLYNYTIYVQDNNGLWNNTIVDLYNITVQDIVDNDAPTWDTLTESDDPLELGNNETININVYDASTISWVYLEFAGSNHTMSFVSGDTYRYTLWQPSTVGVKDYRIYMSDEFNNIGQTGLFDITVQDTTAPLWFDLVESDDPLELGNNETITVNATDISGINLVYLEYESANHTMQNLYGNNYNWSLWLPSTVGVKNYKIHVQDNNGLWNSSGTFDITVQDTTLPIWFDLVESDDPLELGNNETITVNATDISGINVVYLEYESANHTMVNIYGNTYQWSLWQPASTGLYNYTIYVQDNNGLWNNTIIDLYNITVQDTTAPLIFDVIESDDPLLLGTNETITVNITDYSGLYFVYLEFESANHTMQNLYGNTYNYSLWQPASTGLYTYTIWANDTLGYINSYSNNITVSEVVDIDAPTWDNLVESANPLEFGTVNETITIRVYDASNFSVYFEVGGVNYTMGNVSDTYWYSWLPNASGDVQYIIWLVDQYNNTDSIVGSISVLNSPVIVFNIFILVGLMIIMTLLYSKVRVFLPISVVFLFSLIIGIDALGSYIPFTPYFQIFFLLFQTSIFLITVLDVKNKKYQVKL